MFKRPGKRANFPGGFTPRAEFMRLALEAAAINLETLEGGPFGACLVNRRGEVLAVARNTVLAQRDATCHAEINALRAASAKLGSYLLQDCVIYSTTEPCPMCFSAIHWAELAGIVYGTRINDVQCLGFNELTVSNRTLRRLGGSSLFLRGDFLRRECRELLRKWETLAQPPAY